MTAPAHKPPLIARLDVSSPPSHSGVTDQLAHIEKIARHGYHACLIGEALSSWGIEVVVIDLDETVRTGLRDAQVRQVMINPPPGG